MNEKTSKLSKTQKQAIALSVVGIIIVIVITLLFMPYFEKLYKPDYQEKI